eukprot:SAG11_NODE_37864_length_255_cov_0.525641_1_plen_62_part_10
MAEAQRAAETVPCCTLAENVGSPAFRKSMSVHLQIKACPLRSNHAQSNFIVLIISIAAGSYL